MKKEGDESDSSDEEGPKHRFYKTNTRLVTVFSKTTVEFMKSENKIDLQTKILGISTYLLWTRDFSPKWS